MSTFPPRLTTSLAAALPMPLEPPMTMASTTRSYDAEDGSEVARTSATRARDRPTSRRAMRGRAAACVRNVVAVAIWARR